MKWLRHDRPAPSGGPDSVDPPAPAPRRRPWQRQDIRQSAATIALCYLTGLAVWNISTSPNAGWLSHVFPHIPPGTNTLDAASVNAAWAYVQQEYYIRSLGSDVGTQGAEQGIVDLLKSKFNDRFSFLFTPQDAQSFNDSLAGQRSGSIGITVEARCAHETVCAANQTPAEVVIEDVLRDQPADRAGLKNGDVLVSVAGRQLSSLGPDPASEITNSRPLIIGNPGTQVTLGVVRHGTPLSITVTRQNLTIPSVYSQLFGKVLYVQVTEFETNTARDLKQQLQQGLSEGATSIVLDLRENPGGFVEEAQGVASQFVQPTAQHQNVLVARGRMATSASKPNGDPSTAQDIQPYPLQGGGIAYTPKLVVLVNGDTASAAEIVSACVHDDGRATLVGVKTFGKGSVQDSFTLPDGDELHITVDKWFGPNGESIDGQGITPDDTISLPSPDDRFRLDSQGPEASQDAQLQAALALAAA